MVESLKDLSPLCQKPRYREVGNWMVRHILRDAALPVTWLLLHTAVTANQVTAISLALGLTGVFCLALPPAAAFLMGTILLQLWYFLDHVDGQIARYRKTACMSGRFFDFITHHVIHGALLFGLSWYVYGRTGSELFLFWGFMASLALITFNLINDTKAKTFFEVLISGEKFVTQETIKLREKSRTGPLGAGSFRRLFSVAHKSIEIHVMMNILTLMAIVELFLHGSGLRFSAFIFYGTLNPLLAVGKVTYLVKMRKVDEEFHARFRKAEEC